MSLVWKLLRRHVSVPQFAGFFFANLLGMLIVLLSVQFYYDVLPVFTQGDSFIKKDYLIVSKRISMVSSFSGRSNTFSAADIDEIKAQKFCKSVGAFTSSRYKVSASMGVEGMAYMSTEMFFESVPDRFVDADLKDWHFAEGDPVVPIILPRSYLTIYNFGFAQSRSLPKLSEGVVSMLDLNVRLRGNGREGVMKGRVIGFSNRLNTILVPESFMKWSNRLYAPDGDAGPTRLIVEVYNPADDAIARFLQQKGYDTEEDKLLHPDAEHLSVGAEEYDETGEPAAHRLQPLAGWSALSDPDGRNERAGIVVGHRPADVASRLLSGYDSIVVPPDGGGKPLACMRLGCGALRGGQRAERMCHTA